MMNLFHILLARKPTVSVPLLLLLVLAIGFSCIGCAAWFGANEQLQQIETLYTTVAVPIPDNPAWLTAKKNEETERYGYLSATKPNEDIHWPSGDITYSKKSIAAVAERAPQVSRLSNSGLLSAQLLNCKSLASGTLDATQYNAAFDFFTKNFCVLALKCTYAEDLTQINEGASPDEAIAVQPGFRAKFEVVECLSLMDAYGDLVGTEIGIGGMFGYNSLPTVSTAAVTEDLASPFEPGKTYLVRGFFQDLWYELQWNKDATDRVMTKAEQVTTGDIMVMPTLTLSAAPLDGLTTYMDDDGKLAYLPGQPNFLLEDCFEYRHETNEFVTWVGFGENKLPFCTEYTGDLTVFLESPEGQIWKDTIIPWTELNQNSATLVLTDNLYSTYNFNTGVASILDGRAFMQEEYTAGADVCLVSSAFAQHNKLSVGDTLQVECYDTGIYQSEIRSDQVMAVVDYTYLRLPLAPENRIGLQKEYEIIGIYTSPEFSLGQHNFPADTIFVPKASVPNAEAYEDPQVPYLNALILENGAQEAFAQYMADHDMADTYTFVDMNYEDTRPALETMAANAQRMMFIGLAVFLLVAGLYLFLLLRKTRPVSLSMRLLGVSQKVTWGQLLAAAVPLNLLAAVLGLALGAALFGSVTTAILSATVAFHWKPMLLCVGLETAAMLLVLLVTTAAQARAELMQKRRG